MAKLDCEGRRGGDGLPREQGALQLTKLLRQRHPVYPNVQAARGHDGLLQLAQLPLRHVENQAVADVDFGFIPSGRTAGRRQDGLWTLWGGRAPLFTCVHCMQSLN
jgi:hypothetical protein